MTALPGDRDVQIDRIGKVLVETGVGMDHDGTAWTERVAKYAATELYDAGLRVEAESGGGLEAAWNEAEAALPEGWWVHDLAAWSFDDMAYRAEAATAGGHFWAGKSKREKEVGTRTFAPGPNIAAYGPTPAAALRALAAALTEGSR